MDLPRWAEISSLSEDELYAAFRNTTHTFPPSFLVHRNSVRRIAIDAVMKVGSLEDSELLAMTLVAEQTTIPVPIIRKVFGQGRDRAVVMDYIPGKTLADCWQDLSIWRRVHVIWKIHGYIRQLRRVRSPYTLGGVVFPGPVAQEPQMCYGPMFAREYGGGPFSSYQELTAWFMHKLDVNRRFAKFPPESEQIVFDSSLPLVFTHLDINPSNIIVGDDSRVWLIDWEFAGFYPQWFEYVTMRQSCDFLGRWKLWVVGFMAGFYERQLRFIGSIGWALNTGVLL